MNRQINYIKDIISVIFFKKELSKIEFKIKTKEISNNKNHYIYEKFITSYDESIDFDFISKSKHKYFIGQGFGDDSLNSYRKITTSCDNNLFEKIYYTKSIDCKKNLFFYKYFYPEITTKIFKIPKLINIIEGKKITIVYFEYVKQYRINRRNFLSHSAKISKELKYIKPDLSSYDMNFVSNYKNDRRFNEIYEIIINNHQSTKYDTAKIYLLTMFSELNSYTKLLQHGDLNLRNISSNYVVDWDHFGLYPIGFELGLVISQYYGIRKIKCTNKSLASLIHNLYIDYKDIITWTDFFKVTYFFSLIFLYRNGNIDFNKLNLLVEDIIDSKKFKYT